MELELFVPFSLLLHRLTAVSLTISDGTSKPPTTHRFYMHSITIAVPKHLQVKPREGMASMEVLLAFPVDASGTALANKSQMVHAFLPVAEYGFRFLIQVYSARSTVF